jgi:P2 family phage major capsid protein
MQNYTRLMLNTYLERLGELNGIAVKASESFTADPSVQQTLEQNIQDSSEFLSRVNNIGVTEQAGEKIGLGIGTTIASTTETSITERAPSDPTTLDSRGYLCTQTNFDTAISYKKLDAWAKFADFQIRLRDAIVKRQALDIMCIGFNGTTRAATSDRIANPLLQDVNIGWLQKIRENAPERVMADINVYGGGDYENLDAVVMDATNELIEPWYREDTQLVVILGRSLFADKYFPLVNQAPKATEMLATDLIISQKRIGGLQAVRAPYFPENALLITRLDNLSRYFQEGARRRTIIDNPRRDQIENYESSNDAYVIEDYGCTALVEGIVTTKPATPPQEP